MARLTYAYRPEDGINLVVGRRQLPIIGGENLMMLMEMNGKGGLCIDSPHIRGKELEEFTRKFNLLTADELRQSLEIDSETLISVLNQCVQCVGCRRRVERLFYQLTLTEHPSLDPLVFKSSRLLTVNEEKLKTPQALGSLLYRHHEILNNLLESKLRNKTRCVLHSLDAFRSKPFSETWREVWTSMKQSCREELAVIEMSELHDVLEGYLKKHKFCQGCRTKIEKAYKILVGETNTKEKGFVAALYVNIKKCQTEKHIHVCNRIDFLDALIRRAEPEVNGSYSKQRERHAKTLEIAQEEVLTCVGMIMYERLRRIYVSLREDERACQVLAAVGVHALCRNFDMFVEQKQGISNLELLYQEISRAEKAKQHKREQKKLKKKKKKIEKKGASLECDHTDGASDSADQEEDRDEAVDVCDDDDEDNGHHPMNETRSTSSREEEMVSGGGEDEDDAFHQMPLQQLRKANKSSGKQKQKPTKTNGKKGKPIPVSGARSGGCNVSCLATSSTTTSRSGESKCTDCLSPSTDCPCDVKDSGYGSEPHSSHGNSRTSSVVSSPEGSVVSCSDGFCNHDHNGLDEGLLASGSHFESDAGDLLFCHHHHHHHSGQTLSLEQMLEDFFCSDNDEKNYYIPQEVVFQYQCQHEKVEQERQKLRKTLRENFDSLYRRSGGRLNTTFTC